ncbi:MAG TPA: hypothetical protein PLN11_00160 [Ottowia sp.]|nr:hypothetical protein [Thauera aminoaromatica]HON29441.1 hypothetical protein [Ottowia sp.]
MPIRRDAQGYWHAEACVRRRRLHRRLPAGASARDAKQLEAELVHALHTAAPATVGDPLLTALVADYAENYVQSLRSPETARYHALRIGRWLEGRRASEARAFAAVACSRPGGPVSKPKPTSARKARPYQRSRTASPVLGASLTRLSLATSPNERDT